MPESYLLYDGSCDRSTPTEVRRRLHNLGVLSQLPDSIAGDLAVVATELVSNAVNAGASRITIVLDEPPPHLELRVRDDGPGQPVLKDVGLEDTSGRGLAIISAIARQWGFSPGADDKTVWVRMDT